MAGLAFVGKGGAAPALPLEVARPSGQAAALRAAPAGQEDGARSWRLAAGAAAFAGLACGQQLPRRSPRRQGRRTALRAARGKSYDKMERELMAADMAEESIMMATPVPQSFEQAIVWAVTASVSAAEAGKMRQTMYFNTGNDDETVSGQMGIVSAFAESFVKTVSEMEALEGGTVCAVFTDMGAQSMCSSRWTDLSEKVKMTYFPSTRKGEATTITTEERILYDGMLESDYIVLVGPTQTELPALLALLRRMEEVGKDVPFVMLNPQLMTNLTLLAGALMKKAAAMDKTFLQVFHLEQVEPPETEDITNSAVISRVWPRPYSLWEDNPDDPEAVDGFFLLDINDSMPPQINMVLTQLKASADAAQKMADMRRRQMPLNSGPRAPGSLG